MIDIDLENINIIPHDNLKMIEIKNVKAIKVENKHLKRLVVALAVTLLIYSLKIYFDGIKNDVPIK